MSCTSVAGRVVGITGGGGFIGLRFIERFQKLNPPPKEIRALDLSPLCKQEIENRGAVAFIGSVNEDALVTKFCTGCDVIIHLAAVVKAGGDWNLFRKVNVEGTKNVATKAAQSGVKKFVHFSSVMVYGFQFKENVEESGPYKGDNNPYCQTKIESEEIVQQFNKTMQVHIIRPGDVYGPGNSVWVTPLIDLARQSGRLMLPGTGVEIINHVYIDNLIDGVFLVMDKATSGEAFNITDDARTSFQTYCTQMLTACGEEKKPVNLIHPFFFMIILYLMIVINFVKVFLGGQSLPTQDPVATVRYLTRSSKYSTEKLKRLGYSPKVNLKQGGKFGNFGMTELGLEEVGKFIKNLDIPPEQKKRV